MRSSWHPGRPRSGRCLDPEVALNRLAALLTPLGRRPYFVGLLAALILAVLLVQVQLKPFTSDETIDSYSYYFAARALAAGLDPYDVETLNGLAPVDLGFVFPYLYPPILAMMWRPMTRFDPRTAHQIVVVSGAVLALFNASILWRLIRPARNAGGWLLLFLLLLAVCGPLVSSIRLGQVNLLLGTLIFGALLFERQDEPLLAGFLLALAILIKVTPLVFLADFIVRGRWRSLGATLFFGSGLVLGSVLWIGIDPWLGFVNRALEPLPFNPPMSINGLLAGIGGDLGWSPWVTVGAFLVVLTAVLLWLAWRLPRLARREGEQGVTASWSMLLLFSLLAFPLTWHHHYYLALLPFGYFTLSAFDRGDDRRGWIWLVLTLIVLTRYPGAFHPLKPIASLIAVFLV